jgi:hypothetical protein
MRLAAENMALFSKEHYIQPFWLALLYAIAGEKGKCLNWLEKGYETNDPSISYISSGGFGSMLRDEPRYQELLRKMNLPTSK